MRCDIRPDLFFGHLRKKFGRLSQDFVNGTNSIIDAWNNYEPRGATLPMLAYVLATAYHETAHTMQPIREIGRGRTRVYGKKNAPVMAGSSRRVQNDQIYYGRGYVQLTWFDNYLKQTNKLGVDLITNPDKVMEPEISARILIGGMLDGDFTSRKLSHYFGKSRKDYVQARRIVNGTDKAALIASHARAFEEALTIGSIPA